MESKFYLYSVCAYIVYVICTITHTFIPSIAGTIFPIYILLISIVLYPQRLFKNKAFLWGCVYSLVLALILQDHKVSGFGYGKGGYDTFLIDIAFTLPAIAIGAIFYKSNDEKAFKYITNATVISLVISYAFVLPVAIVNIAFIRQLALISWTETDAPAQVAQYTSGFWGYTMFHIVSLLFATLWGYSRYCQGKKKVFYTVLAIITLYIVFAASITTTLIYIIFTCAAIVYHSLDHHKTLAAIMVIIVGSIAFVNVGPILDFLLDIYKGTDAEPKLLDFKDIVNGGTGYHGTIDGRVNYQQDAIDAFKESPIFGNSYKGGGHSILLNRLGSGGLILFIPYFLMLLSEFKQWYKQIPKVSKLYFLLSWLGAVVLLYNKNVFGQEGFLFISIVIPALCMLYPKMYIQKLHNSQRHN